MQDSKSIHKLPAILVLRNDIFNKLHDAYSEDDSIGDDTDEERADEEIVIDWRSCTGRHVGLFASVSVNQHVVCLLWIDGEGMPRKGWQRKMAGPRTPVADSGGTRSRRRREGCRDGTYMNCFHMWRT